MRFSMQYQLYWFLLVFVFSAPSFVKKSAPLSRAQPGTLSAREPDKIAAEEFNLLRCMEGCDDRNIL